MPRRLLAYLVAAMLVIWPAVAVLSPAFGAEPAFPPGSRIGLEPPGDLKPSTRFPGFEDIDRKVAVTLLELPASAYAELARAANATEQRGLTDVKREEFSLRDGTGLLVTGRAQINDVALHKWILLATAAADKDLTVLINVEVPEAARAVYSDAVIRQALASVTFRPMPIQEQLGLLPFKLGQLAGFRVMQVLAQGGVILTEGPTDDLSKQPYVIVSIGQGSPEQAPAARSHAVSEYADVIEPAAGARSGPFGSDEHVGGCESILHADLGEGAKEQQDLVAHIACLLYTSPSPRD